MTADSFKHTTCFWIIFYQFWKGFLGDGKLCEDVDECARGTHSCRGEHEFCSNIPGSYQCKCGDGYEMKDGFCADMDECIMNLDFKCQKELSMQIMCLNTEGSYTCQCAPGLQQQLVTGPNGKIPALSKP